MRYNVQCLPEQIGIFIPLDWVGRGGEGDIIGGGGEHREQVEGGHWRQDLQLESYLAAPSPGLGHVTKYSATLLSAGRVRSLMKMFLVVDYVCRYLFIHFNIQTNKSSFKGSQAKYQPSLVTGSSHPSTCEISQVWCQQLCVVTTTDTGMIYVACFTGQGSKIRF